MLILIALGVFIILAVAVICLYYRLTKARETLFAARRDRAKLQARLEAARKAAHDAEGRCTQLMHQVNTSLVSTSQALNIARHIEVVRRQMAELLEMVTYSDGAHACEPAVAADDYPPFPLEPGMTNYGPREIPAEPVSVSHRHVDHTRQLASAGYPSNTPGATDPHET